MNFIYLKCKHCGANLKLESDNIQAFCQYCGNKLLIDIDKLSEVLKEKEKTKQIIEKEQHITKRKEINYNYKKDKEKRDFKDFMIIEGFCFGIPFLLCIGYFLKDYLIYIFIGLGIALGLIVGYILYKKFLNKNNTNYNL